MSAFFKTLASFLAVFALVVFAILMVLPTVVSTTWGTKQAITLLNGQIPGTLSAKKVTFCWLGPQRFEGVSLKNLEGDTLLYFDRFETDTPLFNFLLAGPTVGKVDLDGLYLNIVEEYPQVTNFHQALGTKEIPFRRAKDKVTIHLPFAKEIALKRKTSPTDFRPVKAIVFEDVNFHLDAKKFNRPMELNVSGKTHQGDLNGRFSLHAVVSSGRSDKWLFNQNTDVKVKADVTDFPVDFFDLLLTADQPKLHGLLRDALGNKLSLHVDQTLNREDGVLELHTETPTFCADMQAEMAEGKFALHEGGKISFKITPELFDRFVKGNKTTPLLRLVSPTQTTLKIEHMSLPILLDETDASGFDLSSLAIEAELDVEDSNLAGSPFWGDLKIRGIRSTIEALENEGQAKMQLRGEANQNGQPLHIKFDAVIQKPSEIKRFFENIQKQTKMQLEIAGVPLVANDRYEFSLESLVISDFSALKATTVDGGSVNAQFFPDGSFEGRIEKLNIREKHKGSSLFVKSFNFSGTPSCFTLDMEAKKGHLQFAKNGESYALNLFQFPLHEALGIALPKMHLKKKVKALFGEEVEGSFACQEREVRANIEGILGTLSLEGELTDGALTLLSPIQGEFTVTEQFGKKILGEFVPVFSNVVSGEDKLTLHVEPEGFSLPLFPFSLTEATIGNAVVEMGRISFSKSQEIAGLVSFFDRELDSTVPVWFTPIHLQLKKGVVHVSRVDMLFMEEFPLATWGKVDLARDRVNMTLGVTKKALEKAFFLQNLKENAMVQLPLKGRLKEATIDKGKAIACFSAVVAKDQANDGLVGAVFELATGVLGQESKRVPSPTMTPLPWSHN